MAPPEVFMKDEEWRLEISVSAYGDLCVVVVVAANPVWCETPATKGPSCEEGL